MTREVTTRGSRLTSTQWSRAGCGLDHRDERKTHETSSYRCVRSRSERPHRVRAPRPEGGQAEACVREPARPRACAVQADTRAARAANKTGDPPLITGHVSTGSRHSAGQDCERRGVSLENSHTAVGAGDDRIRERVNWELVVVLLGCLAFWGGVVFCLVVVP